MSEWQDILAPGTGLSGPGDDFEERVFAKIRRKKTQRKAGMAVLAVAGILLMLAFFQLFRPAPGRAPFAGGGTVKEEIPLSEDLFFSTSDSRTRYLLEPAAAGRAPQAGREATVNQI